LFQYPFLKKVEEKWENVRRRLTDGDVCGILACIDAASSLKRLRLRVGIKGHGLAPLRGSAVLED